MMTWLSLTTTEKSTADALYCCITFGAVCAIVLSSFSRLFGSTFSPTISFALTYFACSALTSASLIPGGGLSGAAGCGRGIGCVRCGPLCCDVAGGFGTCVVCAAGFSERGNGPDIDSTATGPVCAAEPGMTGVGRVACEGIGGRGIACVTVAG